MKDRISLGHRTRIKNAVYSDRFVQENFCYVIARKHFWAYPYRKTNYQDRTLEVFVCRSSVKGHFFIAQ